MLKNWRIRRSMEDAWRAGKSAIPPDLLLDRRILGEALEAYARSEGERPAEAGDERGRTAVWIRSIRWAALPAAAAVLLLLLNPLVETGVAWGKIVGRVEQAPTLMLHASTYMQQDTPDNRRAAVTEIRMYISREYGARMDVLSFGMEVGRLYLSPDRKTWTSIDYLKGKIEHHAEQKSREDLPLKDPKREVKDFLSRPYKKIGRSAIDGKAVEGIETRVEKRVPGDVKRPGEFVAERLWVEIATGLPLRKEGIRKLFGNMSQVDVSDYKWNVPLDSSFFKIPEELPAPGKK